MRPYHPGIWSARINWRATARMRVPYVERDAPRTQHRGGAAPDSFTHLQRGHDSALDLTVRGALALARAYLRRREPVGLVVFGGTLSLASAEGRGRRFYRILDALIDTQVVLSHAWKGIDILPPRTLPPRSLVIALSPLLDERSTRALLDLRARHHDLAVIEISPLPSPSPGRPVSSSLRYRVWSMDREVVVARLQAAGAAVARWDLGQPLGAPLAVQAMQRARLRAAGR